MDSLERLEGKLDGLVGTVANIDKTLAVQVSEVALLKESLAEVKRDLKPLQDRVQQAKGMSVLFAFLVTAFETVRHFVKG